MIKHKSSDNTSVHYIQNMHLYKSQSFRRADRDGLNVCVKINKNFSPKNVAKNTDVKLNLLFRV